MCTAVCHVSVSVRNINLFCTTFYPGTEYCVPGVTTHTHVLHSNTVGTTYYMYNFTITMPVSIYVCTAVLYTSTIMVFYIPTYMTSYRWG